jgi:hypothetical protein
MKPKVGQVYEDMGSKWRVVEVRESEVILDEVDNASWTCMKNATTERARFEREARLVKDA